MEAKLKASSLKNFTRSLSCLSKYGDRLTFQATRDGLALSTTNSSKSAYARFTFAAAYWKKWSLTRQVAFTFSTQPMTEDVKGEVSIKVLLAILRARTADKTVESVDMEIYDGPIDASSQNQEEDELSSQLIVRIHCKQGVTRTHRLNISVPTVVLGPHFPDNSIRASKLRIGADAVKDVLEHFALSGLGSGKGKARDPQLVWEFGPTKLNIKSVEVGKGSDYLSTALDIDAREFDAYEIYNPPMSVAFQLREFSATITHAEQLGLPLNLHFTEPGSPLFIEIETDNLEDPDGEGRGLFETFFAVATTSVDDSDESGDDRPARSERDKRSREESASIADCRPAKRKASMPVVTKVKASSAGPSQVSLRRGSAVSTVSHAREQTQTLSSQFASNLTQGRASQQPQEGNNQMEEEPLFLQPSQLSQREQRVLKDSGLGDGSLAAEDFAAFMDADGEEVEVGFSQPKDLKLPSDGEPASDSSREEMGAGGSFDDELSASQIPPGSNFRPLFDD